MSLRKGCFDANRMVIVPQNSQMDCGQRHFAPIQNETWPE
jgi:hypothetical protein